MCRCITGGIAMALRYWRGGAGTWDTTNTANWSGGVIPGSGDDVVFDASSGSGTCTVVGNKNVKSVDMTGSSVTVNYAGYTFTLGGSFTFKSGKATNAPAITFNNNATLITDSIQPRNITINGAGKTLTFGDNCTQGSSAYGLIVTNGSIITGAGLTHTFGTLNMNNANTKVLNLAGSNVTFNGTTFTVNSTGTTITTDASTILNFSNSAPTMTTGGGTFTGEVKYSGSGTLTIANVTTFDKLTLAGGTISLSDDTTITGTLKLTKPYHFKVVGGKTLTMGPASTIDATGSSGSLIDIDVVSGTTPFNITRPSGSQVFSCDWLNLNHCTAGQANTFYAGLNSTGSNDINWIFTAPPLSTGNMFLMFF